MIANRFPDQNLISRLRNGTDREDYELQWPNVAVSVKTKKHAKTCPESSFTIITNKEGYARININSNTLRVCEETFLLVNPYQSFDYEINSSRETHAQNIHFNYEFYNNGLYSLLNSDEWLLENPEYIQKDTTFFNNHLLVKNAQLSKKLNSYHPEDRENYFLDLLAEVLAVNLKEKKKVLKVSSSKESTKKELYKRIARARDIIFSNYDKPDLSIDDLCREVSMSKFHFIRVFKNIYDLSPHSFLKQVRLYKAKNFLEKTDLPVKDIALKVGFSESNSLFPLIKNYLKQTPDKYRQRKISNFE